MKILKYVFLVQLLSFNSFAVEIPNHFEDGQVTSASQMNENFQALKSEIEILKTQLEENGETKISFVGVTEEKFSGAGGLAEMIMACDRMVSGSHFCYDTEYVSSIKPEDVEIKEGWLLYPYNLSGGHCVFFSYDGGGSSWALNNNGDIVENMPCSSQIGVACCK